MWIYREREREGQRERERRKNEDRKKEGKKETKNRRSKREMNPITEGMRIRIEKFFFQHVRRKRTLI